MYSKLFCTLIFSSLLSTSIFATNTKPIKFKIEVPGKQISVKQIMMSSESSWLALPVFSKFGIGRNSFETYDNETSSSVIDRSKVEIISQLNERFFLGNELNNIQVKIEVAIDGKNYPLVVEYGNYDFSSPDLGINGILKEECTLKKFAYSTSNEIGLVCQNGTNRILNIISENENGIYEIPELEISIK